MQIHSPKTAHASQRFSHDLGPVSSSKPYDFVSGVNRDYHTTEEQLFIQNLKDALVLVCEKGGAQYPYFDYNSMSVSKGSNSDMENIDLERENVHYFGHNLNEAVNSVISFSPSLIDKDEFWVAWESGLEKITKQLRPYALRSYFQRVDCENVSDELSKPLVNFEKVGGCCLPDRPTTIIQSEVGLNHALLIHHWHSCEAARNIAKAARQVHQTLFEYQLRGIGCPLIVMFCIHGVYISVTPLPPMTTEVVTDPSCYTTRSGPESLLLKYYAQQLGVALGILWEDSLRRGSKGHINIGGQGNEAVEDSTLHLYDSCDGRSYFLDLDLLSEFNWLDSTLHTSARGEAARQYFTAITLGNIDRPIVSMSEYVVQTILPLAFEKMTNSAQEALERVGRDTEQAVCDLMAGGVLATNLHVFGASVVLTYSLYLILEKSKLQIEDKPGVYITLRSLFLSEMTCRTAKTMIEVDLDLEVKVDDYYQINCYNRIMNALFASPEEDKNFREFWVDVFLPVLRGKFSCPDNFAFPRRNIVEDAVTARLARVTGCNYDLNLGRFVSFTHLARERAESFTRPSYLSTVDLDSHSYSALMGSFDVMKQLRKNLPISASLLTCRANLAGVISGSSEIQQQIDSFEDYRKSKRANQVEIMIVTTIILNSAEITIETRKRYGLALEKMLRKYGGEVQIDSYIYVLWCLSYAIIQQQFHVPLRMRLLSKAMGKLCSLPLGVFVIGASLGILSVMNVAEIHPVSEVADAGAFYDFTAAAVRRLQREGAPLCILESLVVRMLNNVGWKEKSVDRLRAAAMLCQTAFNYIKEVRGNFWVNECSPVYIIFMHCYLEVKIVLGELETQPGSNIAVTEIMPVCSGLELITEMLSRCTPDAVPLVRTEPLALSLLLRVSDIFFERGEEETSAEISSFVTKTRKEESMGVLPAFSGSFDIQCLKERLENMFINCILPSGTPRRNFFFEQSLVGYGFHYALNLDYLCKLEKNLIGITVDHEKHMLKSILSTSRRAVTNSMSQRCVSFMTKDGNKSARVNRNASVRLKQSKNVSFRMGSPSDGPQRTVSPKSSGQKLPPTGASKEISPLPFNSDLNVDSKSQSEPKKEDSVEKSKPKESDLPPNVPFLADFLSDYTRLYAGGKSELVEALQEWPEACMKLAEIGKNKADYKLNESAQLMRTALLPFGDTTDEVSLRATAIQQARQTILKCVSSVGSGLTTLPVFSNDSTVALLSTPLSCICISDLALVRVWMHKQYGQLYVKEFGNITSSLQHYSCHQGVCVAPLCVSMFLCGRLVTCTFLAPLMTLKPLKEISEGSLLGSTLRTIEVYCGLDLVESSDVEHGNKFNVFCGNDGRYYILPKGICCYISGEPSTCSSYFVRAERLLETVSRSTQMRSDKKLVLFEKGLTETRISDARAYLLHALAHSPTESLSIGSISTAFHCVGLNMRHLHNFCVNGDWGSDDKNSKKLNRCAFTELAARCFTSLFDTFMEGSTACSDKSNGKMLSINRIARVRSVVTTVLADQSAFISCIEHIVRIKYKDTCSGIRPQGSFSLNASLSTEAFSKKLWEELDRAEVVRRACELRGLTFCIRGRSVGICDSGRMVSFSTAMVPLSLSKVPPFDKRLQTAETLLDTCNYRALCTVGRLALTYDSAMAFWGVMHLKDSDRELCREKMKTAFTTGISFFAGSSTAIGFQAMAKKNCALALHCCRFITLGFSAGDNELVQNSITSLEGLLGHLPADNQGYDLTLRLVIEALLIRFKTQQCDFNDKNTAELDNLIFSVMRFVDNLQSLVQQQQRNGKTCKGLGIPMELVRRTAIILKEAEKKKGFTLTNTEIWETLLNAAVSAPQIDIDQRKQLVEVLANTENISQEVIDNSLQTIDSLQTENCFEKSFDNNLPSEHSIIKIELLRQHEDNFDSKSELGLDKMLLAANIEAVEEVSAIDEQSVSTFGSFGYSDVKNENSPVEGGSVSVENTEITGQGESHVSKINDTCREDAKNQGFANDLCNIVESSKLLNSFNKEINEERDEEQNSGDEKKETLNPADKKKHILCISGFPSKSEILSPAEDFSTSETWNIGQEQSSVADILNGFTQNSKLDENANEHLNSDDANPSSFSEQSSSQDNTTPSEHGLKKCEDKADATFEEKVSENVLGVSDQRINIKDRNSEVGNDKLVAGITNTKVQCESSNDLSSNLKDNLNSDVRTREASLNEWNPFAGVNAKALRTDFIINNMDLLNIQDRRGTAIPIKENDISEAKEADQDEITGHVINPEIGTISVLKDTSIVQDSVTQIVAPLANQSVDACTETDPREGYLFSSTSNGLSESIELDGQSSSATCPLIKLFPVKSESVEYTCTATQVNATVLVSSGVQVDSEIGMSSVSVSTQTHVLVQGPESVDAPVESNIQECFPLFPSRNPLKSHSATYRREISDPPKRQRPASARQEQIALTVVRRLAEGCMSGRLVALGSRDRSIDSIAWSLMSTERPEAGVSRAKRFEELRTHVAAVKIQSVVRSYLSRLATARWMALLAYKALLEEQIKPRKLIEDRAIKRSFFPPRPQSTGSWTVHKAIEIVRPRTAKSQRKQSECLHQRKSSNIPQTYWRKDKKNIELKEPVDYVFSDYNFYQNRNKKKASRKMVF